MTYYSNKTECVLEMLSTKRPAFSETEQKFIKKWLVSLNVKRDKCGNIWKRVGHSNILWSCHTDTVHKQQGTQKVSLVNWKATVAEGSSNCLGADDTAGVWLMREMILAGVPGVYVFHRGEEIGGVGSDYIVKSSPSKLEHIKAAIAFDRRGTTSIITHQGLRCCSDKFAFSMKEQLDSLGLYMELDDTGLFTDTANYVDNVGECTNISVGYGHEHTRNEELDLEYLLELREAMCMFKEDELEFAREPGEMDYDEAAFSHPLITMEDVVARHPDVAARFLEECNVTIDEFLQEVYTTERFGY